MKNLRILKHLLDFSHKLKTILGDARYATFIELPNDKKNEYVFEVELLYQNNENIGKEIEELILNLEEDILSKAINQIMIELGNAERIADTEKIKLLLTTSKEITTRLNIIKSSRFLNK